MGPFVAVIDDAKPDEVDESRWSSDVAAAAAAAADDAMLVKLSRIGLE